MIERPNGVAGRLFRQFKIYKLTQQMRSVGDAEHANTLADFSNPIRCPFPVSASGVLDKIQDISPALLSDPAWRSSATLLTNRNVVRVAVNIGMAQHYAKFNNQTIIAWIQRPFPRTLDRCTQQARMEGVPVEDVLRRQDQLQFLFVPGAPVCITHNVSVCLGIANGAMATLHSIALDESDDNADVIWQEIDRTPPGQTYWLQKPPARVNIRMKAKNPEIWKQGLNCISIECTDGGTYVVVPMKTSGRATTLKTGRQGRKKKNAKKAASDETTNGFHGHDIDLGFAMTFHKGQGATLSRVIIDTGNNITLPEFYVGISRVREGAHIAKCHINLEQRMKLNALQHDPCIVKYYEQQHPEEVVAQRELQQQRIEEKKQTAMAKLAASGKKSIASCKVTKPAGGGGSKDASLSSTLLHQEPSEKQHALKKTPVAPAPKRRKVHHARNLAPEEDPTWKVNAPNSTNSSQRQLPTACNVSNPGKTSCSNGTSSSTQLTSSSAMDLTNVRFPPLLSAQRNNVTANVQGAQLFSATTGTQPLPIRPPSLPISPLHATTHSEPVFRLRRRRIIDDDDDEY